MPVSVEVGPEPAVFKEKLLDWYRKQGRDLPWRNTRDPYRIWLSEIMLQQTGVSTVIPYYQRFLDHFPTVSDLAAAPVDAIIRLWAGLGYYSRARNLHATARQVVACYNGAFPSEVAELASLPGVGRSTAGAIAALSFEKREPILDGNVRRILSRLFAYEQDPGTSSAIRQFWRWADWLTPETDTHDYTQAIMDLGATVCVPRKPLCGQCPVNTLCLAREKGLEQDLPRKRVKKTVPVILKAAVYFTNDGQVLIRRRPLDGFLGGLMEFPDRTVENGTTPEQAASEVLSEMGVTAALTRVGRVRHAYSHFRLELVVFCGDLSNRPSPAKDAAGVWVDESSLSDQPLHGAHKKMVSLMQKACNNEDEE